MTIRATVQKPHYNYDLYEGLYNTTSMNNSYGLLYKQPIIMILMGCCII